MQRRTLARWLVFAALVCFGLFLGAGIASAQEGNVVQGQNGSTDSTAISETATAVNALVVQAGPAAGGAGAPASAAQTGDNDGSVSQASGARSGDAAAGSQVAGVAGDGATIQANNTSDGATAVSGPAVAFSTVLATLGPNATAVNAQAQAGQIGDNAMEIIAVVDTASGDAVAGSQVLGVVGDGDHTIQVSTDSVDATAESGPAVGTSFLTANAGPVASAIDALATAQQIGDNDETLSQSSVARSGDAVAGSTIAGVVGNGSSTTQETSTADTPDALSGDAVAVATMVVLAGPSATSFTAQAQSSQTGDNEVEADQADSATSGDAIAGSQVTGLVSEEVGHINVQNQQSSEGDTATSGNATAVDTAVAMNAGPIAVGDIASATATQIGDDDLTLDQASDAQTGDAVAGSQVTGVVADKDVTIQNTNDSIGTTAVSGVVVSVNDVTGLSVGPEADSGDGTATATQTGDNAASVEQAIAGASGDAVAGSQVTGVVADPSEVTVQNVNSSDGAVAVSGDVDPAIGNGVFDVTVGPLAQAGDVAATASQIGDNDAAIVQDAALTSGDAVAGSQVTGVVADHGDATIQNTNDSLDDVAVTGAVAPLSVNAVDTAVFGPLAQSGTETATASQTGDNTAEIDQSADLSTGDAVAGAQVTGVVTDGADVTVQNVNTSDTSTSVSGQIVGLDVNRVDASGTGPFASSILGQATASQIGDNDLMSAQEAVVATGDAVAGAQVTGVVADGSDVVVQNTNDAVDAVAVSGDAPDTGTLNQLVNVQVGPFAAADGGNATATQTGDNAVDADQAIDVATGDAVAGAQVTGVVASGGDATIQNVNTSDAPTAVSGSVGNATNEVSDLTAGPDADAISTDATASQIGDTDASIAQTGAAETGDAVAGGQVTGVVTLRGDVTVQNTNDAVDPVAVTGVADVANVAADVNVGASATGDGGLATSSQTGDDALDLVQDAASTSGDAVAGAQVTGIVTDSGDVTVQNTNVSDADTAVSGNALATNTTFAVDVGPSALAVGGDATASQVGDDEIDLAQTVSASSGDAVAGAQVVGAVEDDSTIQLQNFSDTSTAVTLDGVAANTATGAVGPAADAILSPATTQQVGDSAVEADQDGEAATGDVVAGGQVVGIVGFGGATLSTGSGLLPSGDADATLAIETAAAA